MQWVTDAGRWRAWLVDSNVRVLVWLTAALVMGILALNVWLIGQAIAAARTVQFDATRRDSRAGSRVTIEREPLTVFRPPGWSGLNR